MEKRGSQSLIPVFVVVMIFGLMLGTLDSFRAYLPTFLHGQGSPPITVSIYMTVASLARFAIDPVLVFIGVYLVGRKIDLKAKLTPLIVLLIVGAYVGNLIGYIITPLISKPELLLESTFMGLTSTSPLRLFFVAFTALAIAYIRR